MKTRWAFIGAGRHVQLWIAPALQRAANAELVGVWSRQESTSRTLAERHGIPRIYQSLEEAVADQTVDAVFVATPNSLHASHAIAALRAGKHVLVEKPMAINAGQARDMVGAARAAGVQLGIGFHFRHNQLLQEARRRILGGDIGEPFYATALFNLTSSPPPRLEIAHAPWKRDPDQIGGASALMGMGCHVLDLLRWLIGQEVESVGAISHGATPEQPLESFAQVAITYESGAQGHVAYGGRFPLSKNDVVIYGSNGRMVAEGVVDVATQGALHVAIPEGRTGIRLETFRPELVDHYQREVEAFGHAVSTGEPFAANAIDGLRSVEIQDAVIESQRTGQRVSVKRAGTESSA
jgi:1,5-anhydro-D-fructose reductase (1,5-anhydro-D-mannitol-forming)